MRIESLLINPAFSGKSAAKAAETVFDVTAGLPKAAAPDPAKSAGVLAILPPAAATPLSFENVLALQLIDAPPVKLEPMSATDIFLQEARKSPMERMREQVLEELGLTEESLGQMAPEERRAAEDKIREMIEEKLRQAMGGDQAPDDASAAAMLKTLL